MRADIDERERELQGLKETAQKLDAFVQGLTPEALAAFEETISQNALVRAAFDNKPDAGAETSRRFRGPVRPADVAAAVKSILQRERRPMRRGELVPELEKLGVQLAGRDKNKNLGTILWRHKNEFIQIDNLGYWLKDVPLDGVYTPQE